MKKKIYLAIIVTIIAIIFNTKYTQANTTVFVLTPLETIKNASNEDVEKYLKSKYGSSNDTVSLDILGNAEFKLNTTLKCLTTGKKEYKMQLGKRKKYKTISG